MDKYVKRWLEWCDTCGHGFKVDAETVQFTAKAQDLGVLSKILRRKPKVVKENIKPKPSKCPVCGKADNVTVIKLQEDKVYVQPGDSV